MKARRLFESASYGPEQLKALGKAFDDAWERVSSRVSARAEAVEAARLTLADIMLGLAKKGDFDPEHLADAAVRMMLASPSNRRQ
jgi:hypothetical protein